MKLDPRSARTFCRSVFLSAVSCLPFVGCGGADSETNPAEKEQSLALNWNPVGIPPGASENTLAPVRAPLAPEGAGTVYMTSVEETLTEAGSFVQVLHVYEPNDNHEPIQFEVAAIASNGSADTTHTFTSVKLTSPDGLSHPLPDGRGQYEYATTTSGRGWYRFEFRYAAPNANRTLKFKANGTTAGPLPIAWSDPPAANMLVSANVFVAQGPTSTFFKGGAYRNTDSNEYAYADSVSVDGNLLYRRGFDQGVYNFPLGGLSAGNHTLTFSLTASSSNAAEVLVRRQ